MQNNQFDDLCKSDMHVGQLFNCFAILTVLISFLGLFGLVTFTTKSKVKEIGVRKVLVLVAAAIAFPVAWYRLSNYLQGYAYRTNLQLVGFCAGRHCNLTYRHAYRWL